MTKKKKGQIRSILITQSDDKFTLEYPDAAPFPEWEVLGLLEHAKTLLQTRMIFRYQNELAQQQEEAK